METTEFEELVRFLGEEIILQELQSYLSTDDIEEFIEHCRRMYDIDED